MRRAALQLGSQLRTGNLALSSGRVSAMSRIAVQPRQSLGLAGTRSYAASHAPLPQSDGHGHGHAHGGAKQDSNDILWLLGSLAVFLPVLTYVTEPKQSHKADSEKPRGTSSRFKNLQAKAAAAAAAVVEPVKEALSHAEEAPEEETGAAEPIEEQTEVEAEAGTGEASEIVPESEGAEPAAEASTEPSAPVEGTPVPAEEPAEPVAAAEEPKEAPTEVPTPVSSSVEAATPKEISFPYVIIGAGTAAFSAEEAIHELQPSAEVLVIGEEESLPYMRPPLSKELWSVKDDAAEKLVFTTWDGKPRSIYYTGAEKWAQVADPSEAAEAAKTKLVFSGVQKIDIENKTVHLASGKTVRYGKLLIATGGTPKALEGAPANDNIKTFRTVADFKRLRAAVSKDSRVVVIGGGFLGSELTMAMTKHAGTVTQVFPEKGNLSKLLPKYLSQWITDSLKGAGASVLSAHEVKGIEEVDGSLSVAVAPAGNGESSTIPADEVVLCLGISPNVSLGEQAGLQLDAERGGLLVDAELKTSSPDVFAAGDVASYTDMILGQTRSEHHDSAVMTGRVAGQNMCGTRRKYIYQPFFWTDLGPNVGLEGCGLLDPSLPTVGVWAKESQDGKQRKGAVFYLNSDKQIVGIALVNMYGKASAARELIRKKRKVENVEDLAGVFELSPPTPESD